MKALLGKSAMLAALLLGPTGLAAAQGLQNPPGVQVTPSAPSAPNAAAPQDPQDIRGLHGPIPIPEPFPWASWAFGGLLTSLLAFVLWSAWRRRRRPARSVSQIAFEALDAAQVWIWAGRPRAFSIAVSDAVRDYLEARFELRAAHQTTAEFLEGLRERPIEALDEHRVALGAFLRLSDYAKFARGELGPEQMQEMHAAAWQLVEETWRPRAEPPGEPEPHAAAAADPAGEARPRSRSDHADREDAGAESTGQLHQEVSR